MDNEVELRNLSETEVDERALIEAAQRVLRAEGRAGLLLSVALVDDERMVTLNQQLLGRDYPTDVIAFEAEDDEGEIIICVDTARRQATAEGHDLTTELRYLVAHGVLHVLGHDDSTDEARRSMLRRQDDILKPT